MQRRDGQLLFSPSDLIKFMQSESITWLDRLNIERPGTIKPAEDDPQSKLFQQRGIHHEKEYLEQLSTQLEFVSDMGETGGLSETIAAMRSSSEVIYQGELRYLNFSGKSDFLNKVAGASNLGDYHYEVADTKLSLHPKPYFVVQLCCYAEMLEHIQGVRPKFVEVVLGDKSKLRLLTDDYFFYYRRLKEAFLEQQASFNPDHQPIPLGKEDFGRWRDVMDLRLEEIDHLGRVANIRRNQIKLLHKAKIHTATDLARSTVTRVPKMDDAIFKQLRTQARLQMESRGLDVPLFELKELPNESERQGLQALPPPSDLDVCFDMEGFPSEENENLEYLFGVTFRESDELVFKDWWAHDVDQEREAFTAFIDWVYARWVADPKMHIYHYAAYEKSAMRRLMSVHSVREREVDALLRNEVFVDLYSIVRQSVQVGEPKYSIKNIEHLYQGKREGEVSSAVASVVAYQNWIDHPDGPDWHSSKILKEIRDYNKDDCDSTWRLVLWLRVQVERNNIHYVPNKAKEEPDQTKTDNSNALEANLLAIAARETEPEKQRVDRLLANLVHFHKREAKPVFWEMYDRASFSHVELSEDINCLGDLRRTEQEPYKKKGGSSLVYEYSYDIKQQTKLSKDTNCFVVPGLESTTIVELDVEKGLVLVTRKADAPPPPSQLSLIPNDLVPAGSIEQSINDIVASYLSDGSLPDALKDFLYRNRPSIADRADGPLIRQGESLLDGAKSVIANMQSSCLCIQGPPGSGKTFTAAAVIVQLLRAGKRVGISSNSHKAICHLMKKVVERAKSDGLDIFAAKIGGSKKDDPKLFAYSNVSLPSAKAVFGADLIPFQLTGGTAWAYSAPEAVNKLDYLFVDEAGQMSIANLVGVSRAAKNIVLIGDQMQLAQPLRGTHPGESGQSLLEYLLQQNATIPADFGIFLGTSYRMHPALCEFISRTIYDDRLRSAPEASNRFLLTKNAKQTNAANSDSLEPDAASKFTPLTAGLMFEPVAHEGNEQGSEEEVERIKDIVSELLHYSVEIEGDVRPVELKDIIVVAPFNMQVRALQKAIPGLTAGSVDKFQGQEAKIVIVSMCSSDLESSTRGMEFLLSKNRLNVAISRAQILAVVVASPSLARGKCTSLRQMALINLFSQIVEYNF